jgi:hypothetical protein
VALSEWQLTPHYLNEYWSPEILFLMFYERLKDIEKQKPKKRDPLHEEDGERRIVSDTELFKLMKINPRGNA